MPVIQCNRNGHESCHAGASKYERPTQRPVLLDDEFQVPDFGVKSMNKSRRVRASMRSYLENIYWSIT